jgi:hypothetical protein
MEYIVTEIGESAGATGTSGFTPTPACILELKEKMTARRELEQNIKLLKQHIEVLTKERDEELNKIVEKYHASCEPIYTEIAVTMKKIEDIIFPILSNPETLEFDGWEQVTSFGLDKLTHEQLEFLVWKKLGRKDTTKFCLSEHNLIYERTLEERKAAALKYLCQENESCRYCHSVTHTKGNCPKLANKVCGICNKQGHTTKRCKRNI